MSILIHLHDGPVPRHDCHDDDAAPGVGARVVFHGLVRPIENSQPITGLHYQTYEPMTLRQLHALAERTVQDFGLIGLRADHSRGFVPAGGCSFRLVIDAAHRKEALAAMDHFIDAMKRDVPLWKQPAMLSEPGS